MNRNGLNPSFRNKTNYFYIKININHSQRANADWCNHEKMSLIQWLTQALRVRYQSVGASPHFHLRIDTHPVFIPCCCWNTVLCTVAQLRFVEHSIVYSGAATVCGTLVLCTVAQLRSVEHMYCVQWRSYDLWNTVKCKVALLRFVEHCKVYSGTATICGTL